MRFLLAVEFMSGIRIHWTKITYILLERRIKICDGKDCTTYTIIST